MISEKYLQLLACPACKSGIEASDAGQYLLCRNCGLKYPVRDGIPVMLVAQALRAYESNAAGNQGPKAEGP